MKRVDMAERIGESLSGMRYRHTIGVAEKAVKMAALYGADPQKAETAALLHDIARGLDDDAMLEMCRKFGIAPDKVEAASPALLHGKVGAVIARNIYGITDQEILDAITYHTTGRSGMSVLEKVIFIADMIEPGRDFPGVTELRELALANLDKAVIAGIDSTLRYVLDRGLPVHPDSIEARNSLLVKA